MQNNIVYCFVGRAGVRARCITIISVFLPASILQGTLFKNPLMWDKECINALMYLLTMPRPRSLTQFGCIPGGTMHCNMSITQYYKLYVTTSKYGFQPRLLLSAHSAA